MRSLVIIGVVITLLGALALAIPSFTTKQENDVAKVGDLKLTAKQETPHVIPPAVGETAVAIGVVLIGIGVVRTRRSA
jgi:hypothetical protein